MLARLGTLAGRAPQRDADATGGQSASEGNAATPPLAIDFPLRSPAPETQARDTYRQQASRLARQERWDDLTEMLRAADLGHERTPAGMPVARLLCEGAFVDTMSCARRATASGDVEAAHQVLRDWARALGPTVEAPWRALLLASVQLEVAALFRGAPGTADPNAARCAAALEHLEAALMTLRPHDPRRLGSAALAAARCRVIELLPCPEARLAAEYEALIAAEPDCPAHLRAYGVDLSPARFGSWPALDRAARRMAMLTAAHWGSGAYAWMWWDVLAQQPAGFAHVEAEYFVAALHDILEARPGQHMANKLAAYCGLALSGDAPPASARARITGCFDWIVQDHLREVHPEIWTAARPLPGCADPAAALRLGTSRARSALAEHFADEVARGRSVIFTETGIHLQPAPGGACTLAPCPALAYPRRNLRDEDPPCLT